jgi:hypothetical protein
MNNVPTYFKKKKSKPQAELSKAKQSLKSSYTIPEGLLNERRGEHGNIEINASLSKTRCQ